MGEKYAEWISDILGWFNNSIGEVTKILCKGLQSNSAMYGFTLSVQNVIKPICYTIIGVFFLIEFIKMSMKFDVIKWEFLLKILIKFFIAKLCIDYGPMLLDTIYATVSSWIKGIANTAFTRGAISEETLMNVKSFYDEWNIDISSIGDNELIEQGESVLVNEARNWEWAKRELFESQYIENQSEWAKMNRPLTERIGEQLVNSIGDLGFKKAIAFAITSIVPALVLVATSLIIKVMAYARMIEIFILLTVMPIPFAFILESEGGGNITRKYILNFTGVCLQGLMMVLACELYQYIVFDAAVDSTGNPTGLMLKLALCSIILILTITKCGHMGKKLVGGE